jgi:hypothetical protein
MTHMGPKNRTRDWLAMLVIALELVIILAVMALAYGGFDD